VPCRVSMHSPKASREWSSAFGGTLGAPHIVMGTDIQSRNGLNTDVPPGQKGE